MNRLSLSKIAVVDIETTGLSTTDSIVEIGICELDLLNNDINRLFDAIIKDVNFSKKDVNAWIFSNSNLKYENVINAAKLETFFDIIQKIFKKYPAAAYNSKLDFSFLESRGFEIVKKLPDPMIKATNILKIRRNRFEYKYPSVVEAWRYYFPGINYVEKHRAYDDVMHEALIILKMFKKGHWFPIDENMIQSVSREGILQEDF